MSIKTLLVDDENSLLDQAKIFLEKEEDIEVSAVSSAEKAVDLMDEVNFDVIVSDYQMPDKDGLEFLEEVRKERNSDIPFLIFTGKGREEVAMKALNLGANRYLQKGGDPKSQYEILINAIKQEFEHWKSKRKLEKSEKEKSIILERTSDAIAYHDSEHNIIWANRSYLEGAGMDLEEMKGKKCYEAWYRRDEPCEGCPTDEALKSGRVEKGEISPPEGERCWLITGTPIKDEEGNVARIIESSLDITEIKEKEKKIKKLFEASTKLEDCTSEEEIYKKVLKSAEEILEFESCTILMEDGYELIVKATKTKNVQKGERYSKDEGIRGLTFQNKKSYLIEDLSNWDQARPTDPNYKSTISIPIGEEGVFQAFSYQGDYFDESDLHLAEILISHLLKSIKRLRSQKELKKSKKRFESVVSNAQMGIYIRDLDGRITYVNERFAEIHGYEKEELIGMKSWDLLHPDSKERIGDKEKHNEKLVREDDLEKIKIERKDGEVRHVLTTNSDTVNIEGDKEIFGVVHDITEKKRYEEKIKELNEEYETIFDNIQSSLFLLDVSDEGKITFERLNQYEENWVGFETEEVKGKTPVEVLGEELGKELEDNYRMCLEKEESITYEEKWEDENGEKTVALTKLTPVTIEGKVEKIIGNSLDITERKKYEQELKRKEKYIDHTPEYITVLDEEGNIKYHSYPSDEILELDPSEFVGDKAFKFAHPDDREKALDIFSEVMENPGEEYRTEIRGKGKEEWIWFEVRAVNHLDDPEVEGVIITAQDIRQRKETEEKLKRSKKRFKTLISNAQEGIYIRNLDGTINYVNEKFADIHGYEKEELIGMKSWDLLHPDYRKKLEIKEGYDEGLINGSPVELKIKRKDGETRDVLVCNEKIENADGDIEIFGIVHNITQRKENEKKLRELHEAASMMEKATTEKEVCEIAVNAAEEILDFDICVIDLVDEKGKLIKKAMSSDAISKGYMDEISPEKAGLAGKTFLNNKSYLIDDATDYNEAKPASDEYRSAISVPIEGKGVFQAASFKREHFDDKDLETVELLVKHVYEALERIAIQEREEFLHSLLRHDVENKNQIVKGYLELLKDSDLSDEDRDLVEKAERAAKECTKIIEKVSQLKEIEQEEEIGDVNLSSVLDKVLSEHQNQLEEKGIRLNIKDCDCKLKGGPLLEELFSNLVDNSVQHSDCGEIRISSQIEEDECVVTVEDNGLGIPNELKDKIFDKGSKRGETAGTGLGLYMVKEIARSYGGNVEVKDSDLGGARFDVHLKSAS